jgi:hypothetical protein
MSTAALVMLITVNTIVTAVTVFFLYKVLSSDNKTTGRE